jgi:hypothetical protein
MWQKGTGTPVQKVDNATGEILCLVEVPAVYKTIARQVVRTPATMRTVDVPAEFTTVRRQVMKTPPTTREIEIPAEYTTVTRTVLAEPAREVRTVIPAEYETITKSVKTADERLAWQPVECETAAALPKAVAAPVMELRTETGECP